jgi:hypothetical protein
MLNSKYPILCVTMNKVSDLNLAFACHNAGIVPSLSIYSNTGFDVNKPDSYYNSDALNDVDTYMEKTGSDEISFAFQADIMHNDKFFNRLLKTKNRLIEIIEWTRADILDRKILERLEELQSQGRKIGLKSNKSVTAKHKITSKNLIDLSDYYLLKGAEGAGLVGEETTIDLVKNFHAATTKSLVASGGITTAEDIRRMISAGASAVGIGTLFAMSEESRIPNEVKLKLLEKTKEDLIKVNGSHRGIMFTTVTEHSNGNLDKSLVTGIETGQQGHINMGHGLLSIKNILPVKDIVDLLVEGL